MICKYRSNELTAKIELLGYQKTSAGVSEVEININNHPLVSDAIKHLSDLFAKLYLDPERVIININGERVDEDTRLSDGDIVTFIPIIGGG